MSLDPRSILRRLQGVPLAGSPQERASRRERRLRGRAYAHERALEQQPRPARGRLRKNARPSRV